MFLFVAGLILVDRRRRRDHGRRALRDTTGELAATVTRPPAGPAAAARSVPLASDEPLLPPEPDTSELVIRATHVEAPPALESDEPADDPDEPEQLSFEPEPRAGAAKRSRSSSPRSRIPPT